MEKILLFDILERMEIELTPEEREELQRHLTTSLKAWEAYWDGLIHSDKGQYSQAAQSYQKSLIADPNFTPPQEALTELRELGLVAQQGATTPSAEAPPPPQEPPPPPPSGELGTFGNAAILTAGIVGGLGLLIGLPILVANQSDDSGSGGSDPEPTPTPSPTPAPAPTPEAPPVETDTEGPTVIDTFPPTTEENQCVSNQNFRFYFSEAMDPSYGTVSVITDRSDGPDPTESEFISQWGGAFQSLDINITESNYCYLIESATITISGFRDTAGNFLTGRKVFRFVLFEY